MENTKYTKAMKYADIETVLQTVNAGDFDFNVDTLIEFVQTEAAALGNKAAKAKAKAAERKTEVDELGQVVLSLLTAEPQTRDQITAQIEGEDVTVAKVGARLKKLFDLNLASKVEVPGVTASGKKTTHMAYFIEAVQPSDSVEE